MVDEKTGMSESDVAPEAKAFLLVTMAVFMPHPDDRTVGDFVEAERLQAPIFTLPVHLEGSIPTNPKLLPPGYAAKVVEILGQLAELARCHVSKPLPPKAGRVIGQPANPLVQVGNVGVQMQAPPKLERAPKPKGAPTMQVFASDPVTGNVVPITRPELIVPGGRHGKR